MAAPVQFFVLAIGIAIVGLTLRDVIDSVVIPGAAQGWLKLAERIRTLSLPVWRKTLADRRSAPRMSRTFAPFVLVATLAGWTVLLVVGFGLVLYGVRDSFDPEIRGVADAIYTSGVSLVTIGTGEPTVKGVARWAVLAAGFSGLFVITLTVSYILSIQSALHERDTRVVSLTALPGAPRTGIAVLETYGRLDCRDDLRDLFRGWAHWSSAVAYGHSAHPALAYFRSVSADVDWPTAIGAIMDAAVICIALADAVPQSAARFLLASGTHAVETLARRFNLAPAAAPQLSSADLAALAARLTVAGYAVRSDEDALQRLTAMRSQYMPYLTTLAEHLGSAPPDLL